MRRPRNFLLLRDHPRKPSKLDMMPDIPFWWILGTGVALSAWWAVRVMQAGIEIDMFIRVVQRTIEQKNISRAVKLAYATSDSPAGAATKAAILASISREEDNQRPAGYRGTRNASIETVRARIRAKYDEAFDLGMEPLQLPFYLALPAPLPFVGTILFLLVLHARNWLVIGAAAVCLIAWIYVAIAHLRIRATRNHTFDALWPSFEAIYHDRHTIDLETKATYPLPTTAPTNPVPEVNNPLITFDILEPGKPLRTVELSQNVIKIGRLATSHVQLSSEKVARMHAVIEIADGKATIIDLGASAQTTVNLEKVNKHELANGDVIGVGDVELVVRLGNLVQPNE